MILIPCTNAASQEFQVQLGDVFASFAINWNDRASMFYLTLSNYDTKEEYLSGAPIVLGQNFLEQFNYRIGAIFAYDETNTHSEATLETLGDAVNLYWMSEAELETA